MKHNWERSDMENFDKVYGPGTFYLFIYLFFYL